MTRNEHPEHSDLGPPRGVHAMAVFRWVLVALMALIALLSVTYSFGLVSSESANAASVQYYCPMHPQVVQDHPGECPICSMTLVKKKLSHGTPENDEVAVSHRGHRHEATDPYFCPMHPEETGADANASCRICEMRLEKRPPAALPKAPTVTAPKAAEQRPALPALDATSRGHGVPGLVPVQLGLDRVQTVGVRTAPATLEDLAPALRTVGFVSADEARTARVHARFTGWIEQLAVPVTGQKVVRGQVLAGLYNLELLPAQQELLATRRWSSAGAPPQSPAAGVGGSLEQDARARLELFGLSPAEIDQIVETGKPMRTVAIVAPIGGYVVAKNAVQGAYVQPGTELFEIADLSKVWVLADIYESEMARVGIGQPADVVVGALPNQSFSGKVGFLYPVVDAATQTLRVRIELDNKALQLRPGMYADVTLQLDAARGTVVPTEALVDTGDHQYVFVARSGGRFEPRRVTVGRRTGDKLQILEGLAVGEVVVTTANFLIDSESRLRAAIEGTPEQGR